MQFVIETDTEYMILRDEGDGWVLESSIGQERITAQQALERIHWDLTHGGTVTA